MPIVPDRLQDQKDVSGTAHDGDVLVREGAGYVHQSVPTPDLSGYATTAALAAKRDKTDGAFAVDISTTGGLAAAGATINGNAQVIGVFSANAFQTPLKLNGDGSGSYLAENWGWQFTGGDDKHPFRVVTSGLVVGSLPGNTSYPEGSLTTTGNATVGGTLTAAGATIGTNGLVYAGSATDFAKYPGIWFAANTTAPTTSNYAILYDPDNLQTIVNAPSGGTVDFRINNATAIRASSTGVAITGNATVGGTLQFGPIDTTVPGTDPKQTGYATNGTYAGKLVQWYPGVPAWQPFNT